MAVKVPGFARLLVALTLLAWGQFSLAETFYWSGTLSNAWASGSSPASTCKSVISKAYDKEGRPLYYRGVTYANSTTFSCFYSGDDPPTQYFSFGVFRYGDSCLSGSKYNESTGECVAAKDCSSASGKSIYAALDCTYVSSSKLFTCPSSIKYTDGCEYVTAPNGTNRCDVSTSICINRFIGSGIEAPSGASECEPGTCVPAPAEAQPSTDENCISTGSNTTCITNEEKGCVSVNGKEACYEPGKQCGTFNGTFTCIASDKPNRNCGYANGKQVCFDPNDPTKIISETSSDHPVNGGNADGDDTNDPRPAGATGGNSHGSNAGATNQAVNDLGEKLGPKIDKTNSLLDGIGQKIDSLLEGLFGDQLKDADLGTDGEAKQAGEEAAAGLPGIFEEQQEKIQEQRDQDADSYLKSLPNKVQNEWFGANGELVGLNNVLDKILLTAMGCADYRIPLSLDSHNATLVIPVCQLTRVKPLLEWVIWMVTLIGLWKIFYSALRQEDVKASKGGF